MALVPQNLNREDLSSSEFVRDVLKSMGWDDGSFLPIANEDNLKLIESIRILSDNKVTHTESLQDRKAELVRVEEIFKTASTEIDQNLKLLTAHKSQFGAEHHLFKLSEHENSRWKSQIKDVDKETKERSKLEESSKLEILKLNESMNRLSENIQWAKTALSEWREVMMRGEEANKLIEKFCKQDAGRAEDLDARRRLLHEQIMKQRTVMLNTYEERKSLEVLLDRTGQLYRQAHFNRRQLVATWKDAVNQMNQREKDIRNTEKEIEKSKIYTQSKLKVLQKEEMQLNLKKEENSEIEIQIAELNIASSDLRNRFNRLEDAINLKSSELLALRKTVQNESQKLNNLRNQNRQMLNEEKDKENLFTENCKELEQLKEKYEKIRNSNADAQDFLKQIEDLLETEEKNMKVIHDQTARLSGTLFRSEQQLFKLQEAEKSLMLECQMLESGISKTKSACKSLEKELFRQTEILYNVDYKIQQTEMKIAQINGSVNEEEAVLVEKRKKYLEILYDEKKRVLESIQAQIEKIEMDMKKLTANYQNAVGEYERLNHKLKEKKIFVEGGEKQLKQIQQEIQEKLVDQNLLKMRIIQMEKQMTKQNERTYSLERHKMELEAAMSDRLIDIKAQQDILLMKKKCLQEERAQMKVEIGNRMLKIEQLKKRYECAIDLLGKNDDGSTKTAVQIKIENAQEKYLLLNDGNELSDKIIKAEHEIKSMENTLRLMNFSNNVYKKTFERVSEDSPEIKRMNDLQNQYCQAVNSLRTLKSNLAELFESLDKLHEEKEEFEKMLDEVQRTKLDSNDTLLKIHKELMDQETKLERADRELKMATKAAKKRIKDLDFLNTFEKDNLLRERDDRNNSAMQQLADLVDSIPEMTQTVTRHFLEKGLSLPTIRRAKSQLSWKSEGSLTDLGMRVDVPCTRGSHRSFLSGSSTSSSSDLSKSSSKVSVKQTFSQQSGLSVVKISFPGDTVKKPAASSKTKSIGKSTK